MQIANQNNYPNTLLGYGTGSIKAYGCTLACLSAISGIEILKLHTMLRGTSFADSAFAGASKNLINWTKLSQYTNGKINFIWRGYGYDQAKINDAITKHGFCLVEVLNSGTKHWIVAIGNKKALDPLTGGEIPTNKYPSWTGWSEIEIKGEVMNDDMMEIKKTDFENLVKKSTAYDEFANAGYKSVNDITVVTGKLNADIESLSENVYKLSLELTDCQNKIPSTTEFTVTGKKTIESVDGKIVEISYKANV